jgi:hypothetical protein
MVVRMTGAGWLATVMRVERELDDALQDDSWLLFGPTDPDVVEGRDPAVWLAAE